MAAATPLAKSADRAEAQEAYSVCHARCRTSKNVGPFSACRCRCGGRSHGSDTLGAMSATQRTRAITQMREELRYGAALVQMRVVLATMKEYERHLKKRA